MKYVGWIGVLIETFSCYTSLEHMFEDQDYNICVVYTDPSNGF